ncbi:MAG TPA: queuosine precursor transporter, partial [Candidatus Babeliales bacterium]|nr:queuosine precursor transporter [Candidatus Babeliales bacterium]
SGLLLNLTQEYFGPKITRLVLYLSLSALLVFVLLAQFQLWYLPVALVVDQSSGSELVPASYHLLYQALLTPTPRLLVASLGAFTIAQNLDAYLYQQFQKLYHHRHFILRNYSSLLISQFVDTALFTVLGLAGTFSNLWELFWFSYLVKLITIMVIIPLSKISLRLLNSDRS